MEFLTFEKKKYTVVLLTINENKDKHWKRKHSHIDIFVKREIGGINENLII